MCLIVWNWQPGADTALALLSNRDEFHARPAQALHWWDANPASWSETILAGRDLQAGGTWLGVRGPARLAAITNFRAPSPTRQDARSRGELVTGFLQGHDSAAGYLQGLVPDCAAYNPFNLLAYDGAELLGLQSRQGRIVRFKPGWGGVSNADFNTPWPKLLRLQAQAQALSAPRSDTRWHQEALELLQDRTPAPDADLPDTGVGPVLERALSSIFIAAPQFNYGTRASTVVTLGSSMLVTEQVHTPQGSGLACSLGLPAPD